MKKIFYGLMALVLFTACSNEEVIPETSEASGKGLVKLVAVGIGSESRAEFVDGKFAFTSGDKVLVSATVNGGKIQNSFTFDGGSWLQDAPAGSCHGIYAQDNPTIHSIVSYAGKVVATAVTDQSSEEKYLAADYLRADDVLGTITYRNGKISATLAHAGSDFVLTVKDGDTETDVLAAAAALTVTVDQDGTGSLSATNTYTAWNSGKADGKTVFRVILPAGCSIVRAELAKARGVDDTKLGPIYLNLNSNNTTTPSAKVNLEANCRYTAGYTYYGSDVIRIYTADDLAKIGEATSHPADGKYLLMNDLDMDLSHADGGWNKGTWIPICPIGNEFSGQFNGNGYTIRNLSITGSSNVDDIGLFGYIYNGTVYNLHFEDVNITYDGNNQVYIGTVAGTNWGRIDNCSVNGITIAATIPEDSNVSIDAGGIAGRCNGDITACTVRDFTATIEGNSTAGGIVGQLYSGRIVACGADKANLIFSEYSGGIIGKWTVDNCGYIYSCYVKDSTKGTDSQPIEGSANLMGGITIQDGCTANVYYCAYRPKDGSITYGVGGTKIGPTNGSDVNQLIIHTGTIDSDWPTASRNLNVGIDEWNGFDPTLPCNWEWDTAYDAEVRLKEKQ